MAAEATPSYLYVPELAIGATLTLSEDESHYLAHVCRARPDEIAHGTDGLGGLAELRVLSIGKAARVRVERLERAERERRAWVWCGAPEGQRADWLVEKLAELGVERWQPLACDRGEWKGGAGRKERWERLAIAALRQSRRRFLMEVRDPIDPLTALSELPEGMKRWIASPLGESVAPSPGNQGSVAAIGPAPGFTPAERAAFEAAGFQPIRLSDGRLRSETAALAWAVWWSIA